MPKAVTDGITTVSTNAGGVPPTQAPVGISFTHHTAKAVGKEDRT